MELLTDIFIQRKLLYLVDLKLIIINMDSHIPIYTTEQPYLRSPYFHFNFIYERQWRIHKCRLFLENLCADKLWDNKFALILHSMWKIIVYRLQWWCTFICTYSIWIGNQKLIFRLWIKLSNLQKYKFKYLLLLFYKRFYTIIIDIFLFVLLTI